MKELKAVPAEPREDDEEWCERGCSYHWEANVSSGSLVILEVKGDQAYLSAEEAEIIGQALLASARIIRERDWKDGVSLRLSHHDDRP